jgi:hypothetical protein
MKKRLVSAILAVLVVIILIKVDFAMIKMTGLFYARASVENACVIVKYYTPKFVSDP